MMSVAARSASAATGYYLHLQEDNHRGGTREEYYAQEGSGNWTGTGAKALGLSGEIKERDFNALASGHSPTGEALVQNAGNSDRRAGWDCTFSAPKSVSVIWALSDKETSKAFEQAHQNAVARAIGFIEQHAVYSRRGSGGTAQDKARPVVATFQHGTSREHDPQLHTHCFIFNSAQRPDGSWGTLESRHFYDWQKAAGALYRVELADRLQQHGYRIERDSQSFRLADVPRSVERDFSTRRRQIEQAMHDRGTSGARAAEVANLATREAKEVRDPAMLRAAWKDRAQEMGYMPQAMEVTTRQAARSAAPSIAEILNSATERQAVVREQDICTATLQAAQGSMSGCEALQRCDEAKNGAVQLVGERGQIRYSTQEMAHIERNIIDLARSMAAQQQHQFGTERVSEAMRHIEQTRGLTLSAEQRDAIDHICSKTGRVAVLVGDAGTGKSTALEAVREAYQQEGYSVLGCAPSGKAAAGLEAGTGIESSTIHGLERRLDTGVVQLDSKTVLIMDEAAMTDARLMHSVVSAAERGGSKIVLVGDHKQLQPVGPGAPFRHLAAEGCARLSEIHRQHDEWQRSAVRDIAQGEVAKAMLAYIDRGQVTVARTHNAALKEAANHYVDARSRVGVEKVLCLAATNKQVNDLNREIRTGLQGRGELRDGREYQIGEQKIALAVGDRVVLTRNNYGRGVRNGDLATVLQTSHEGPTIRLDRNKETIAIHTGNYPHLKHGYAITTHRAQGATAEQVVVYGSAQTSREMAYVQASRARESTNWVFTAHHVKRMAEQSQINEHTIKQSQLERLADVLKSMSRSSQAESTLDYQRVDHARAKEIERGQEHLR